MARRSNIQGHDEDEAGFIEQPIDFTDFPEGSSPADYLRGVLTNPKAMIGEKISAAKALADIERRAGGPGGTGADRLTREELCAEIARMRDLIGHNPLKS